MKKSEIIRVKISGINERGKAYGFYENEKVYVNINCAKDQIVEGRVSKTRKRKIELKNCIIIDYAGRKNAMFDELEKQSSGSVYQYYTYEEQLYIKNKIVKDMLDTVIKNEYVYEEPTRSVEEIKYRNKMEFSFGNELKDGPTILGLHKKNSFHDIVDVKNLKLMDENFNRIYIKVSELVEKYRLNFYHRITHEGYLRNLVIRKSTDEILINLVTTSTENSIEFLEEMKDELLKLDLEDGYKITGIIHTINDNLSDTVASDKEYILYGKRDIVYKICGLEFSVSPYSFFQTNTKTVEKLYEKALSMIEKHKLKDSIVFDLFSGTGTIGQIVSKNAKFVYGIELISEAVEKANENAKKNGINNCKFIAGDVFVRLDELERADLLILDPPRPGVGQKTLEKLVKYNTENIIYISCNPRTLVEDLKYLNNLNYEVKRAGIVDMFPYTNHVETVVLLTK